MAPVLSKERIQAGRDHVNAMFASTGSGDITDRTSTFPSFTLQQLTLGKVLGKGGFGTVSEVRAFAVDTTNPAYDDASSQEESGKENNAYGAAGFQMESRLFIAKHCLRNSTESSSSSFGAGKSGSGGGKGDARYAIKELSVETKKNGNLFLQGLIDMAVETRFLSDLEHPNIIKMRAICHTSDGTPFSDPEKYFIVMDRLYDTLEKRLQTWKTTLDRLQALKFMRDRNGTKNAALYEERIVAAFDLSAALEYLHERQIIYRDLKPENIGFDIRNDVKIFDFGLAKELHMAKEKYEDGTYKLTEMTGSPRYMAPEVALGKPYNEKCDVYSFAILLWEMISLNEPYQLMGMKTLQTRVWQDNGEQKRPYIPDSNKHKDAHLWTVPMKLLLKRSWGPNIQTRNNMSQVSTILRKECVSARDGDETGLEHCRRRSTFVFRPSPAAASSLNKNDGSSRRGMGGLLQRMASSKSSSKNFPAPSLAPAKMMSATSTRPKSTAVTNSIAKKTTSPPPRTPPSPPPLSSSSSSVAVMKTSHQTAATLDDECSV